MRVRLALFLVLAGCLDLALPTAPTRGPGTVRATVMTAAPGRAELVPAKGTTLSLVGTSLTAVADDDGNVTLSGLTVSTGRLLFALEGRSKLIALEAVNAGFGRDVNLGQVVLSRNGSIAGQVKRGDRATLPSGHGGISVFLPQLPQLTYTGDDGSFVLGGVPEGVLVLSAFATGYEPEALSIEVGAGREEKAQLITLKANPGAAPVGRLSALVKLADKTPVAGARARVASSGKESGADTNSDGRFSFETLPVGVYSLALDKQGLESLRIDGVLVAPGLNEAGPYTMREGTQTTVTLDGGPMPFDGGAARVDDAGVVDAGVDAGFDAGIDAGVDAGIDAGVDAGIDAGVDAGIDAGVDAGIDAGVDAGIDAGVDAGLFDAGVPLPIAIIGALPARVLFSTLPFQLDGLNSMGTPAISRYTWSVDTGLSRLPDGGPVIITPNDSGVAWAPTMGLPVAPALVTVSLQVTDLLGRTSAPATAGFVVGDRPLALFDAGLPTQMYSNQTVAIDATPSRDPMNSGITSRRWTVSAGAPITTSALDGGAFLTITTQTVPATQTLTINHFVTNGLGFESLARTHSVTLIAGPIPQPNPWSVMTVGALTVDGGTEITLKASLDGGGNGPEYGAPSNFSFSWVSITDAGTPPRWVIANANQPTASVYLPIIDGPPQRMDFQVTATTNSPLTPGSTSATLSVLALDRQPPRLTAYSTNSIMGTVLDFTEPMNEDPASCLMNVPNGSCSVALSTGPLRTYGKLYRNNRALYVTRPPFAGELWNLRLSTVPSDVVGNNLLTTTSQDFLPALVFTPTYLVMTGDAVVEPRPGLSAHATDTLTNHLVRVFGSNGTDALAVSSGAMNQCSTAPCPTTTATLGASPTTSLVRPTSFTMGATTYYQPEPGLVFVSDGGAGSEVLPAAPGTVFGQTGGVLSTIYVNGTNLRIADFADGGWDVANELTAQNGGFGPTTVVSAMSAGPATSRAFCIAARTGTALRVLTRSSTSAFGQPLFNNPPLSLFTVKQAWVYGASSSGCNVAFIGTDDKPSFIGATMGDFGTTGNIQFPATTFGVSSMDVIFDPWQSGGRWWAVVTTAGVLDLFYTVNTQPLNATTRITPPASAVSFNVNPACIAANPRLIAVEQAIYVVWQEKCAGQPWNVYLRGLY